ncbi:MAG TPA: hypothetical protein ENI87_14900, partial [bacterium]|nr:hypothetical protein [bacterium]
IAQIAAMGEPAVEVVVNDLLRHPQGFVRAIGLEAIAGIGGLAVPAVIALSRSDEVRDRRVAARALGAIGAAGTALDRLRELARSPDWQVRSEVAQALRSGGDAARDLLLAMLADDDAFVRRKAAESLAVYRDRAAADALIAFLERCKRESDWDGELAAQKALQQMSGSRSPRTAAAWRRFAAGLPRFTERHTDG